MLVVKLKAVDNDQTKLKKYFVYVWQIIKNKKYSRLSDCVSNALAVDKIKTNIKKAYYFKAIEGYRKKRLIEIFFKI